MCSEHCPTLAVLIRLFNSLNEQGIRYCHWKSNAALDRSLGGLTDLDLLVDRRHAERFRLLLHQHDVKPIVSPPDKQYPAVEDYLGFDPDTGRLFHMHVHYQLVLGEQFVKNYRLPLEEAFLDHVRTYEGLVKIPSPELEVAVLAVRALLKYRDRDVVKDILSVRTPGLPSHMRNEFEYLLGQTNLESISRALQAQADLIPVGIVLEFLNALVRSARPGYTFYRLRRGLRRALSAYQRHSRWWAVRQYLRALLQRRFGFVRRLARVPAWTKKVPAAGGMVVAVIGADGAGKSTVVRTLCKWLSWKLEVRRYYMGSQERSPLAQLLHVGARLARKIHRLWSGRVGESRGSSRALRWLARFSYGLYQLSIARNRFRFFKAARRQAAQGAIVVCDRYPLAAIHQVMEGAPMDGPRIAAEAGSEMDATMGRLARLERNIYRQIHPPDHVFVLHVSPEVSQQRKPEHALGMIEAKSRALREMDAHGLHVTDVDADQPLEQVVLQVKKSLWQLL
jgi:thymidylate kinase